MLVQFNVAARAPPPKAPKTKPQYHQPEEMDLILDALEQAPLKWKTITYLMIDTGCRRGEEVCSPIVTRKPGEDAE